MSLEYTDYKKTGSMMDMEHTENKCTPGYMVGMEHTQIKYVWLHDGY